MITLQNAALSAPPPGTSAPDLVVHILDDEENGTVERSRFAVQSLEAGAVLQRAVCQAPRVALHPRGQAPGQLGREQGMREMVTQAAQAVPQSPSRTRQR